MRFFYRAIVLHSNLKESVRRGYFTDISWWFVFVFCPQPTIQWHDPKDSNQTGPSFEAFFLENQYLEIEKLDFSRIFLQTACRTKTQCFPFNLRFDFYPLFVVHIFFWAEVASL